ncbi:MAG: dihydropteroate synthase [Chromatiaceae bacterium]|nr:dihydropteroate synthase [Gammaproteobacteria bacterium]MCP5427220.1 dihydropteroate synthase [Chromatiaceae bacterium]MCB1861927.1 dihydropteroate synthase [Gammaproteobacteria bacterium]MCB1871332.1 dihydropteroate synthase [Gammaproteobacteria bacterium]MCB1880555.1 dihydropteroate synthase [Gammaproteobacteria bacterium]
MGILNVTPDSFSDGGTHFSLDKAVCRAREMVAEGADIIDVGGESTRPGAQSVPLQQELDRVVPVIEKIAAEIPIPISVDTSKPQVMRESVAAGAGLINDVMALRLPGALQAARDLSVPVCLMHMLGEPRFMQQQPVYGNVVAEVRVFLEERVRACEETGISREKLLLDPGFGFGKSLDHNLALLKNLRAIADIGLPLLIGISRKSMIGKILDERPVDGRLFGSLAAAVMALERGAAIVRVHDVAPTVDAIRVVAATQAVK